MLRILLADDHAVVRQGVKQILADAFAQATFGEAQNAHELRELVAAERWDIVVLDLTMPGGNGLEALKQIKHVHPQLPVLILSMYPEDQYAVRTIRAGAAGYLNKESAPEELVRAMRKVLHGGEYISASVADELVLHARHEDDQPLHKHLSRPVAGKNEHEDECRTHPLCVSEWVGLGRFLWQATLTSELNPGSLRFPVDLR